MASLSDHLSNYAAYHRDRRNVATHLVGIPMIVLGLEVLLARAALPVNGPFAPSLALAATVGAAIFYFTIDRRFGAVMTVLLCASLVVGTLIAAQSHTVWLSFGVGLFAVGWVFQFVGHIFEGRKPAFVDDLLGLAIGPLFVVAEVALALGLRPELKASMSPAAKTPAG